MKFETVSAASLALVGKVVVFNKLCETDYECNPDPGMKGRVKTVTLDGHGILKIGVDIGEFETHNDPMMKSTYYDKDRNPTLNMKEAGFYKPIEVVYSELNYELPFDLEGVTEEQKLQTLLKEYRPSMDLEVLHAWSRDIIALLKKPE